jgi:LPXTG-motif cell wall-anchored protein
LAPDTTLTAVGTDASGTEDSAAPLTLPQTGGPNLLMWIEALALVIGALLLLTGSRVDRNRR